MPITLKMNDQTFNDRYKVAPDIFKEWMQGKLDLSDSTILDFGCDTGLMALGLVHHCNAKRVFSIDITDCHQNLIHEVSTRLNINHLPENLEFYVTKPDEDLARFFENRGEIDCVFSWSVFEHVSQPIVGKMVGELYKVIRQGGYAFIQIAPLYYSAFGAHLDTIIPEPWAHLTTQSNLFKDAILHSPKVGPYTLESDEHFEEIKDALWENYDTLNRITADELINLFIAAGFTLVQQYRSECAPEPSEALTAIYNRDLLKNEQVVGLFQKL